MNSSRTIRSPFGHISDYFHVQNWWSHFFWPLARLPHPWFRIHILPPPWHYFFFSPSVVALPLAANSPAAGIFRPEGYPLHSAWVMSSGMWQSLFSLTRVLTLLLYRSLDGHLFIDSVVTCLFPHVLVRPSGTWPLFFSVGQKFMVLFYFTRLHLSWGRWQLICLAAILLLPGFGIWSQLCEFFDTVVNFTAIWSLPGFHPWSQLFQLFETIVQCTMCKPVLWF